MQDERLIVFAKAPRPGTVKTRLARTLGAAKACAAYQQLADTLFANLARLERVELRYAPDDAENEIQGWLRPGWQAVAQGLGDLGSRLSRAFEEAFRGGAKRVVIIGSDCPEVTARDVRDAWRELKGSDLVVGPATDGGYWLIGLGVFQPALFEGISWSSEMVLAETLQRAKAEGLGIQLLRILTDVDSANDWREFLAARDGT